MTSYSIVPDYAPKVNSSMEVRPLDGQALLGRAPKILRQKQENSKIRLKNAVY
jgi:hypothetical protein